MTLIDPRDHAGRPIIHGDLARIEEKNKWKQMGWDGMGDRSIHMIASCCECRAATAIDRGDDRRWSYRMPGRPADHSFIHSFMWRKTLGHRSAFLLRLSVGGYGASAMPCPRRKIKLNFYTILAILEKPSLWSCSICTRRIYFPWPM
jgi:hypothetical protein